MRKLISLFSVLLVIIAVSSLACGGTNSNGTTSPTVGTRVDVEGGFYTSINSAELNQMLQNKDFILVNTNPVVSATIPDTDFHIPVNELVADLSQVSADKAEKIVVYCMVGASSSVAAAEFVKMGYTNIYNLSGGIVEWQQQGYSVIAPQQ